MRCGEALTGITEMCCELRDAFIEEFNNERPHKALEMKRPAEIYAASPRAYTGKHYPFQHRTVAVDSGIWLVSFMDYDLG